MGFFKPTAGPGNGVFVDQHIAICTNRSGGALAKGDIVMLDHTLGQAEVDNATFGSFDGDGDNSVYNNVVDPATAQLRFGIFGVAQEAIADNAEGKIMFRGVTDVSAPAGIVAGDAMVPTNASNQGTEDTGATGAKIVAIAHEAVSGGLAECLFDGVFGLGFDGA